jgi:hypothetical protein
MTDHDLGALFQIATRALGRTPTDAQRRLYRVLKARGLEEQLAPRTEDTFSALIALAPRPTTLEETAQAVVALERLAGVMTGVEAALTLPTLDDDLIAEVEAGRHDGVTVDALALLQERRTAQAAQVAEDLTA